MSGLQVCEGGWRLTEGDHSKEQTVCKFISILPRLTNEGDDRPNSSNFDSGSSSREGMPPTGWSVPHTDATALIRPKTSFIGGQSVCWACQQSSSSFQTLSERPSSSAFVGFEGFLPATALNATSGPLSFPNGSVPVSTCTGRINVYAC